LFPQISVAAICKQAFQPQFDETHYWGANLYPTESKCLKSRKIPNQLSPFS